MAWEYALREIAADADRLLRHGNVPCTWLVGQIIAHVLVQGPFTAPGQVCASQLSEPCRTTSLPSSRQGSSHSRGGNVNAIVNPQ